jgi:diguanylate cyclase (GGDEF)-like protein
VKSVSVLRTARPSAFPPARLAVLSGVVVAATALVGSVAFVVAGEEVAGLGTAGAVLFVLGALACSLALRATLRRSRAGLHALIALGQDLERVRRADDLAAVLARHGRERLGFARAMVLTRRDDRWEGAVASALGGVLATGPVEIGPLAERAWSGGTSRLLRSLEGDPVLDELLPGARNIVVAPLVADGEPLGVVLAEWGRGRRARIPAVTVDTLAQSASQTAVAFRNAGLLAEVEYLATRDGLTRVPNRRLFEETLSREVARSYRRSSPLSLVVLDVDHFKRVNDTAGHLAGDAVLREVGGALVRNAKASDLAARYGGDEFVVLLPDCAGADALRVAERLRAAVAREVTAAPVTVSAGVGEMPANAGDGERLVAAADAALYAAKRDGRNRSVLSDRVSEPGEAPLHPSLRRRPAVDDATSDGVVA